MNLQSNEDIQDWMKKNLVDKKEAVKITGQSDRSFRQSVDSKQVSPFFEIPGSTSSNVRLYLREDLEEYAKTKRS